MRSGSGNVGFVVPEPIQLPGELESIADLITGIDHIAVAVEDLDAAVHWYAHVFGFPVLETRETRGEYTAMKSAVVRVGNVALVLLQGTSPESQVCRFIEQFGPGVHHFALRVRDIQRAMTTLRARSVGLEVGPLTDVGITQTFLVRTDGSGVRLELVERTEGGFSDAIVEKLFLEFERRDLV
jgi:methylmalonyl-CoA/ethylmalonyl-CoA epimerase